MKGTKQTILIVDDSEVNRKVLRHLLQEEYAVREAPNGRDALAVLAADGPDISAVLLDLIMPVMDGYSFLKELKQSSSFGIPVIVTTGNNERESEEKAFDLGAWDFVPKPYKAQILKYRLQSAIARSEKEALKKVKQLSEHDTLTGLHNRTKFFETTRQMLNANPNATFAFIRFDVDRFSLINTFFGNEEGDRLLRYIAARLTEFVNSFPLFTYGRIEADQFAMCCAYNDVQTLETLLRQSCQTLRAYPLNFEIVLTFGIYLIADPSLPVRQMLDNANLAAKKSKGYYSNNITFYNEEMGRQIIAEQEILNDMNEALAQQQFCLYIQPKYDLHSRLPVGGEALVRWQHPTKGVLAPGAFLPIFEKNGFIAKLDYYVWDKACSLLAQWKSLQKPVVPLSVNVSRVHLYNPQLTEMLCALADRYEIAHELLHLEITESVYTEHSLIIQDCITKLHQAGFVVMMDDFGSGYSSLNILKDVDFDVLKIDMRFFETSSIKGRGEKIVASVIRMAKWLGIPTIAEGVETQEQVSFLHDMDCEFVQGYCFAKPMPISEYEQLLSASAAPASSGGCRLPAESLWQDSSQIELLFSTMPQPIVLCEFSERQMELIRVNQAFYDLFGYNDPALHSHTIDEVLSPEYREIVLSSCRQAIESRDVGECDYLRSCADGKKRWIHLHIKYINQVGSRFILLATLWDIGRFVELRDELARYEKRLANSMHRKTMLIVDDIELNRTVLCGMFEQNFDLLQAENGAQALEVLKAQNYAVDIILLDLIMPVMDGTTFLQHKKQNAHMREIPVVIITVENDPSHQINTLALGANDYVAKPFVQEVVVKRVNNVLESSPRIFEMIDAYDHVVEISKHDGLTGVYNRTAIEALVNHYLALHKDTRHGLLVLDLDDFKAVNDAYGHIYGDEVLKQTAQALLALFEDDNLVCRLGGDEFAVFFQEIGSEQALLEKAQALCDSFAQMRFTDRQLPMTISVGLCLSDAQSNFIQLYGDADAALYQAKKAGKAQAKLSCKTGEETTV